MSTWETVGGWVKENVSGVGSLVGSLLVGNIPGAVATGVSLVAGATGTDDPKKALQMLQQDSGALLKLEQLANEENANIRAHIQKMAELELQEHQATQQTIRSGDNAEDVYVRHTRPRMARQSWYATILYCLGCGVAAGLGKNIFDVMLAGILSTPAWAYLGLRTADKLGVNWQTVKNKIPIPRSKV